MLTEKQFLILKDISQAPGFSDERHGKVEQLIIEGYVFKNGDLYELTAKGESTLSDHLAVVLKTYAAKKCCYRSPNSQVFGRNRRPRLRARGRAVGSG